jgi:hypothetical protein
MALMATPALPLNWNAWYVQPFCIALTEHLEKYEWSSEYFLRDIASHSRVSPFSRPIPIF